MNREQKAQIVEQLKDNFSRASLVLVFDYKGITVENFNGLRRKLEKEVDSDLMVVKNKLAKIAIEGTDSAALSEHLVGPNAALFAYGDAVAAAKVLVDQAKEIKAIDVRYGLMGSSVLSKEQIEALAKLPGREQLLGTLLATFQAPTQSFVSLLANVPRGLLNVLNGVKEQKEGQAA